MLTYVTDASLWCDADSTLPRCAKQLVLHSSSTPQSTWVISASPPACPAATEHCSTAQRARAAQKQAQRGNPPAARALLSPCQQQRWYSIGASHHPCTSHQGRPCFAISAADEEISSCILNTSCSLSLLRVDAFWRDSFHCLLSFSSASRVPDWMLVMHNAERRLFRSTFLSAWQCVEKLNDHYQEVL